MYKLTELRYKYRRQYVTETVKRWYQRARYGYSTQDLWSFDFYLARMLIRALPAFKNSTDTHALYLLEDDQALYSKMYSTISEEEIQAMQERWDDMIDNIIAGLQRMYKENGDIGYEIEDYEEAKRAMHLIAEHIGHLWQ